MRILVLGDRAFAATGLIQRLMADGHEVDGFSRGAVQRAANLVRGPLAGLDTNALLASNYDAVINFIVLKDQPLEQNLEYARSVLRLCRKVGAGRLLHISSINVYPPDAELVDEQSPIAAQQTHLGAYSNLKVGVDHLLLESSEYVRTSFIRPGLIVRDDWALPTAGIVQPILGGVSLVLGDRRTLLHTIRQEQLVDALAKIVVARDPMPVYLLLCKFSTTKWDYAQRATRRGARGILLPIPRKLILELSRVSNQLGLLKASRMGQIRSLLRATRFDNSETERVLGMKFEA